jgi:hypothetical protein
MLMYFYVVVSVTRTSYDLCEKSKFYNIECLLNSKCIALCRQCLSFFPQGGSTAIYNLHAVAQELIDMGI